MRYILFAALIIGFIFSLRFNAYTQCGSIDIYSGSTKGHVRLFTGHVINEWENESELHKRLMAIKDISIQEKYISYNGTGKNVYGGNISFAHGNPGIALDLRMDFMNDYVKKATDSEIITLYDILLSKNRSRMDGLIDKILSINSVQH
jgi:hypothetical protein